MKDAEKIFISLVKNAVLGIFVTNLITIPLGLLLVGPVGIRNAILFGTTFGLFIGLAFAFAAAQARINTEIGHRAGDAFKKHLDPDRERRNR